MENYLIHVMLGILVLEILVLIILIIVQNSTIKNSNLVYAHGHQEHINKKDVNFSRGIMMCRKCYNPVTLPNKKCTCCGQTIILR